MVEDVAYAGRDLEAMSFAVNYHKWILETFEPYLGVRLVEVGAGTGSFSKMLAERRPASLVLVEPSSAMHNLLLQNIQNLATRSSIQTYNATFRSVASKIELHHRPDSIIYVNVLEHIEDDLGELQAIQKTLTRGGRVFIFVPALPWLYGSFDREVGHVRRYTRAELKEKCERTGFRVLRSIYFDGAGVIIWWLKYRLLKSRHLEPRAVKMYDQIVVPPVKRLETLVAPPLGKNLLFIAEKI